MNCNIELNASKLVVISQVDQIKVEAMNDFIELTTGQKKPHSDGL